MKAIKYTTIDDAIAYGIIPALGEYEDDYDVYGIADEAFEPVVDGLNYYFVPRPEVYDDLDEWNKLLQKYDRGEELDSATEEAWDGEGEYDLFYEGGVKHGSEWCDTKGELRHTIAEAMQEYSEQTAYAKKSQGEGEGWFL